MRREIRRCDRACRELSACPRQCSTFDRGRKRKRAQWLGPLALSLYCSLSYCWRDSCCHLRDGPYWPFRWLGPSRFFCISPAIGRVTFDDAALDLENEYLANGRRSIVGLRVRLKIGLRPWFAGRRMVNITTTDVRAYVTQRQADDAANGTINRELSALKCMFTLACQAGKLLAAPHIPMLQEDNVRRGFFEREQFESVRRRLPEEVQPGCDLRVSDRLAHQQRGADAPMAPSRLARRHRSP